MKGGCVCPNFLTGGVFRSDCKTSSTLDFPQPTRASTRLTQMFCKTQQLGVQRDTQTHKLALCAMPFRWPCRAKQRERQRQQRLHPPATWGTKEVRKGRRWIKREKKKTLHWNQMRGREIRCRGGCGWVERLLLFTNVFISSFFTLMWLTAVLCTAAGSSSSSTSSSSSSSSKGFEPAGAVLLGTVKLTTWGEEGHSEKRVVYMHTLHTYIHTHTQIHTVTPAEGVKKCFTIHTFQWRWSRAAVQSTLGKSLTDFCVLSPRRRKNCKVMFFAYFF